MMLLRRDRPLQKLRSDTWGRIPRNLALYRSDNRFPGNVGSAMRNKQVRWTFCKSMELVKKLQYQVGCCRTRKKVPTILKQTHLQEVWLIAIPVSQDSWIFVIFLYFWYLSMLSASLELVFAFLLGSIQNFCNYFLQLLILEGKTRISLLLRLCLDGADWLNLMTAWPWLQKLIKSMLEVSIWWLSGVASRSKQNQFQKIRFNAFPRFVCSRSLKN